MRYVGILLSAALIPTVAALGAAASAPKPKPGHPLVSGTLTQGFGVKWSADASKFHTGYDISSPAGTPVYAMRSGVIVKTGWLGSDKSGKDWGNYIVVQEDIGSVSGYLHIKALSGFTQNKRVTGGKQFATVFRDHLHVNNCYQVAGCQHGAFTNATFSKNSVGWYYRRPDIYY